MKKIFGLIALALFVVFPMSVNATIKTNFSCGEETTNSNGQTIKNCSIAVNTTNNESISNYEGTLTLKNVTLDEASVKGAGNFTATVLGNIISFNAPTPQTGETIEIGSFTVIVDTTKTECSVLLTPTSADVDKEEVKVDVSPVPENPTTGSAVSYIAIGAGILLVAGAFVVSRKNTKMYKI